MQDIDRIFLSIGGTIREAMACIDRGARGIALIVDERRRLTGILTDGDVRRAILAGCALDTPITDLMARKAACPYPQPVTARAGDATAELLRLMQHEHIRQVPLLDDEDRVVDLATLITLKLAVNHKAAIFGIGNLYSFFYFINPSAFSAPFRGKTQKGNPGNNL